MKQLRMVVFAAALAIMTSTVFAGGEMASRKVYGEEMIPAPAPVPVQVVKHKSILTSVKDFVVNRCADVGDVVYQSADAVTGLVGFDLACDDAVK